MAHPIQTSRRTFLKTAGALALPTIVPSSVFGANAPSNRITLASVGVGQMGGGNLQGFLHSAEAQVVAVCDVDAARMAKAKDTVEKHYSARLGKDYKGCAGCVDLREIFARDDIDAVCVSTADHWHVPASLMAVRAGMDVYCEKPLSVTIREGRVLSDAARQYGRIVQMGSMQRSDQRFRFACELVRNGRIGQVKHVKVGLSRGRAHAPVAPQRPPEDLDWDLYVGPAPWRHYHKDCCHYNFRFISDFSGGQMLNWGSHHLDIAQWGLGTDRGGPVWVKGKGVFPDDGPYDNPVTYEVDYRYADGITVNCSTSNPLRHPVGGDRGMGLRHPREDRRPPQVAAPLDHRGRTRSTWSRAAATRASSSSASAPAGRRWPPARRGIVRPRWGHLGNIAMRLGRELTWDPEAERFGDEEANRLLSRPERGPWRI